MCDKCKSLIECGNGEKRISTVFKIENQECDWARADMVLTKDNSGTSDVFIAVQIAMGGRYANLPFDINYCPSCGRKLRM